MSIIETITDVNNTFLSRRELTCDFTGLGGKLKNPEAVDMITKEFKLDGKVVIPMGLKTHVGKPTITGTFYVYEDEGLAKKHVNPTIFSRIEKRKAKLVEAATVAEKPAKEAEVKAEEKPAEKPAKEAEVKAEEKPAEKPAKEAEVKAEEKPAEKPAKEAEVKAEEKPAEKPKEGKSK